MRIITWKRWRKSDGCRDFHEQLGGLCACYRTEELLAELRYTGFPDAAFGKEVGWWAVEAATELPSAQDAVHREAREARKRPEGSPTLTFIPRRAVCAPGGGACDRMRSTVG